MYTIKDKTKKEIVIFCLPISGGFFPCQLGLLSVLFNKTKTVPDIMLASSGGNVSAYLSLGGDFSEIGIKRLVNDISVKMFARHWSPLFPTILIGLFKGYVYKAGFGVEQFIKRYVTKERLQKVEIWTSVFNEDTFFTELFCNREAGNTILIPRVKKELKCLRINYIEETDDVTSFVSKLSLAASSIQCFVEGQKFNRSIYSDGGLMYASPAVLLKEEIVKLVKESGLRLNYFYFEPYFYDSGFPSNMNRISAYIEELFHIKMLLDRMVGVDILRELSSNVSVETHYNPDLSSVLEETRNRYRHFVISLSPLFTKRIPISSFKPEDIIRMIEETKKNFKVTIWGVCKI
ncbi:MAG: hypothetical protein KatS3mg101_0800 [Patescibacteria group bacterium]|nr:MAG: hypothetical protein KatS3mg101_0800 [Patescibacteria group bacterium]